MPYSCFIDYDITQRLEAQMKHQQEQISAELKQELKHQQEQTEVQLKHQQEQTEVQLKHQQEQISAELNQELKHQQEQISAELNQELKHQQEQTEVQLKHQQEQICELNQELKHQQEQTEVQLKHQQEQISAELVEIMKITLQEQSEVQLKHQQEQQLSQQYVSLHLWIFLHCIRFVVADFQQQLLARLTLLEQKQGIFFVWAPYHVRTRKRKHQTRLFVLTLGCFLLLILDTSRFACISVSTKSYSSENYCNSCAA